MCNNSTIPCNCGCDKSSLRGRHDRGNLIFGQIANQASGIYSRGLGLTATTKRAIKPGTEYNQYFDIGQLNQKETHLKWGNQELTLKVLAKRIRLNRHQTRRIAQKLKGISLVQTLENIFNLYYDHVQYELDKSGREQLKTPIRLWYDKAGDCDDYVYSVSTILLNLNIPHALRIAKYSGDWQHVYVVVPKDGNQSSLQTRSNYFVIDPVKDRFNDEEPFTAKKDQFMDIQITELSGIGKVDAACSTKKRSTQIIPFEFFERRGLLSTEAILNDQGIPFTNGIDEKGYQIVIVDVFGQPTKLPAILYPDEVPALEALFIPKTTTDHKPNNLTYTWLLALAAVGVSAWALSGSGNKCKKSKKKGLSGLPKKTAKRKTKTINL